MLAPVTGEMTVVTVDHGQAGAHVTGEIEGRDTGTKREGGKGVPQIVDASERLDPRRELGRPPLTGTEVVQVKIAALHSRKQQPRPRPGR